MTSFMTYRYRIKDATTGKHLERLANAVNYVWNYCNEISLEALSERVAFCLASN